MQADAARRQGLLFVLLADVARAFPMDRRADLSIRHLCKPKCDGRITPENVHVTLDAFIACANETARPLASIKSRTRFVER